MLRIQKASRKVAPGSEQWLNGHERLIWKDNPDILSSPSKEIAQQMFVQNVMAPRLGSQHIDAGVCLFSCFFPPLFFYGKCLVLHLAYRVVVFLPVCTCTEF